MSGPVRRAAGPSADRAARLRELAFVFLKLGTVGFGGPGAHIAMMEEEVVRRRAWLTREEFLDLLAATHLIPGPNSTEMAIHVGFRRAGMPGLLVAGACFILPAAVIVTAAAWSYVRFGAYPTAGAALAAMKPAILVIVLQALWNLGRSAIRSPWLALLTAAALLASLAGIGELAVIAACGAVAWLVHVFRHPKDTPRGLAAAIPATVVAAAAAAGVPAAFALWPMFLVFVKIGAVLYGSGYVLLAFLRGDLVQRLGWLTEGQLLDAVAVGQFTPGPVFTTATFIGYVLGGLPGAVVATLGIFLPAFVFVAISGPIVPRLRRSAAAAALLDGVVVGSLAVMAAVTAHLARVAIVDWITVTVAITAAYFLVRYRANSAWVVLGAGAIGGIIAAVQ